MKHRLLRHLALLSVLVWTSFAHAHDPLFAEIRADADASTVTVRLTFARSVAAHLAGLTKAPRLHYPAERFATDQVAFASAAASLIVARLDTQPLALLRPATAALADAEQDIVFTLAYARPATAARLSLSNPWLARLPAAENYAAVFSLREGSALLAAPVLVSNETPVVVFDLPAPLAPRIARFAGDRAAAISYTFDDGLRDQYTVAAPMLNEAGFKGTFFVIPGRISETVEDAEKRKNDKRAWGTITWPELNELAAQGHEIASHTWSHPGLTKLTPAEVDAELVKARDAITTHIGRPPLTLAFPFNQSTPEIQAAALTYHVAFRSHQLGVGGDKTTVESLDAWADQQVRDHAWGVVMAHGIAYGYAAFTDPEILRTHLRYVKSREADIWVDTFANVARYEKERDDAKLTVSDSAPGRLTLLLTGTLDPARYDIPLTLVLNVPSPTSARAERAGHELPVRVSSTAVQIDATPSPDPITLTWK
jgi:peptidoglycan-N-acetylglucosamine deacetylase